jgi:hypothetical protein
VFSFLINHNTYNQAIRDPVAIPHRRLTPNLCGVVVIATPAVAVDRIEAVPACAAGNRGSCPALQFVPVTAR